MSDRSTTSTPLERHAAALRRLERLAWLMDSSVGIPGTPVRVGLDGLLGFVPVIGDAATALVSLYLVAEARACGVPATRISRMLANVVVDAGVGSVPVAGDLFDFAFKANRRNVDLLRAWLEEQARVVDG